MNYATIKYYDIANGPGVRTSVFVSGCRHHCPGCFNAVAWDFDYGPVSYTHLDVYKRQTSCRRVAACSPNWDVVSEFCSTSRSCFSLFNAIVVRV